MGYLTADKSLKGHFHITNMRQPASSQTGNCVTLWQIKRRNVIFVLCIVILFSSFQKGDPAGVFWHLHSPPSWSGADPQRDGISSNSHRSSQRVWELHPSEQVRRGGLFPLSNMVITEANPSEKWYCGLCVWRSVGEIPACADFDNSLLEDTEQLSTKEIELNDLTLETIQHKWEQQCNHIQILFVNLATASSTRLTRVPLTSR